MTLNFALSLAGKGILLGSISSLLPLPMNSEEKLSFNVLDFLGATQKQGCEYRVAMRKYSKKRWDYCYETSPPSKNSFIVVDKQSDPRWSGLYGKDDYLFIEYTDIIYGSGRFWGSGDIKGLIQNRNNGKKYSINCLGRRSAGNEYGYCAMRQVD